MSRFHTAFLFVLFLLTSCAPQSSPPTSSIVTFLPSHTAKATFTLTPSPSPSLTPSQMPTSTSTAQPPRIFVFFGDSTLAIGEAGDGKKHSGYSFVNNLRALMPPNITLITANYGGRSARWGAMKIEEKVLVYDPDVVTLWWGLNDLLGCPGIFDRQTNRIRQNEVERLTGEHIAALRQQIDLLLARNVTVLVMTTLPVWGGYLPWSHLDENSNIVWESGHWCHYNLGLSQLVQAQRDLVQTYRLNRAPVYLVDVWQVYMEHANEEGMYTDSIHPGPHGVQLIAEEWLNVFQTTQGRSADESDTP